MKNSFPCLRAFFKALPFAFVLPAMAEKQGNAPPPGLSAGDWSSIRCEYERNRCAAISTENGYTMRNFGQPSKTHFDDEGFVVEPDGANWKWGLSLKSYGFSGRECTPPTSSKLHAEGSTVTWDRDAILREWVVNDARGLEHGFTVQKRPGAEENLFSGSEQPFLTSLFEPQGGDPNRLILTLSVRGNLLAEVQTDGLGVQFKTEEGVSALSYTGLKVWDADGKVLPARFEPVRSGDNTLRLTVNECGARYPITIDPLIQQGYLKASNSGTGDQFGYAVAASGDTVAVSAAYDDGAGTAAGIVYVFVRTGAVWTQQGPALKASNAGAADFFGSSLGLSGDTLVVGALGESSNATGVNGNQNNDGAHRAGAAYVFTRSGVNWTQTAYLKASNPFTSDYFGHSVAVSGNIIVVGAPRESSSGTGVNGNQTDRSEDLAGAAYVFVNNAGTWSQEAYLKASNSAAGFNFGHSVGISGDTIVIGAFGEKSNATGVNGNQADQSLNFAGAAYVFKRNGSAWSQQAYLKASNTGADFFGMSVGVSGDTIVVGAPSETSASAGVNGNQSDNSLFGAGAAYVFTRTGTTWSQQAYLKASNPGQQYAFGEAVAVSGDTVAVGSGSEGVDATGVNGIPGTGDKAHSGAVYVFERAGNAWSQQAYVKASNTGNSDRFGVPVAISGNTMVTAATAEASSAMGVNGNQSDNSAPMNGAAYVFFRNTTWAQQAYLKSTNTTATNDQFGWAVAVAGETVVVGAPQESSSSTFVNGEQGDVSAPNSGAAYVFVRSGGVWKQEAYLKASNAQSEDHFGWSVAAAGNYVVIGAPEEDSAIGGVDSPNAQGNNLAANSGAAYVFARTNGFWNQEVYLKAGTPGPGPLDRFGWSLAAYGETVVVGAVDQDVGGTAGAGAAYVFVRDTNGWRQQAFLKATNPDGDDRFGNAVAISANTIVVGAEREDSGATGVNGSETDTTGQNSGAAYVYVRNGEAWTREAYLKASNTGANDAFGWSVAVDGDTVVVGANLEDSDATGVNHPTGQGNNNASGSGAAYIFERTGTAWSQKAYLKASNTGISDAFGYSVAIAGDTVVVGASVEGSDSTGINGAQNNNAGGSGAAYLFKRNGGVWSQESFIKASNTGNGDGFGAAVAMTGSFLVVGAYREDSNARGVNGNQTDNSSPESGAAYTFSFQSQTALEAWRTANFGSPDNSGDGADLADPDHDGIVNFIEFATGQPPKTSLQLPGVESFNGGQLAFTYPRSKAAAAELQFIVEWSDSMATGSWTSAGTVESILSDNGVIEMVKVTIPAGTARRRFVRMRVIG